VIGCPEDVQALTARFGAVLAKEAGRRTLATWLALVWLKGSALSERDMWRLAETKARSWIQKSGAPAAAGMSWEEIAREILA
jgi:hypothetical protein